MDNNRNLIFFTLNNFQKEGGGTIRMYGLLNQLAKDGKEVILISNASNHALFHPAIKHINLNHPFDATDKRKFQALVGVTPVFVSTAIYSRLFDNIQKVLSENGFIGRSIYFLEYLDNTVGYLLRKKKLVSAYYNDLHGIPTIEFKFRMRNAASKKEALMLFFKFLFASVLDKRIYGNSDGFIFASQNMKDFFNQQYPKSKHAKSIIIPYLISEEIESAYVDDGLVERIKAQYNLSEKNFVILFAGGFKKTGGMTDLIQAVGLLIQKQPHIRLLLIGDGPVLEECVRLVNTLDLNQYIHFVGRTKYDELRSYQEISDLLVCPDKQNTYSQLIVHVKYFDALAAGKLVINGSFPSVKEINPNDQLSISFTPSDVSDLANKINLCIENQSELEEKYKSTPEFVLNNFTYKSYLKNQNFKWF
jgi:glycosyltransferase involved in cell wall biosynthesis